MIHQCTSKVSQSPFPNFKPPPRKPSSLIAHCGSNLELDSKPPAIRLGPHTGRDPNVKKPGWLRQKAPQGEKYEEVKESLSRLKLNTVCEEAQCPNIGECWNGGSDGIATATIMVLGDTCTRGCRFCAVKTSRNPAPPDPMEPYNTAEAVVSWGVDYIVVTSVDRDDLPDGGSGHFAETVKAMKRLKPDIMVECLTSDFRGDVEAVSTLVQSGLDVFAHNIETVKRLQRIVRDPRAGPIPFDVTHPKDETSSQSDWMKSQDISPNLIRKRKLKDRKILHLKGTLASTSCRESTPVMTQQVVRRVGSTQEKKRRGDGALLFFGSREYEQSLSVLKHAKLSKEGMITKSSIMLGLGETDDELKETMADLRAIGVDILTLGQYLQPTPLHLTVKDYVSPEKFAFWKDYGESIGFRYVASGPLVRSSYRAGELFVKTMVKQERAKNTRDITM
ncbi:lipoyl synthase [Striga asiatica]|uniref:Lipoyl synthase, mitochondrial n=1 Tax=Striga asiatica TaxID=4170 RepID=A0A5A7R666_STRAF|nr:lipoyl synthase [Striga asiatica]